MIASALVSLLLPALVSAHGYVNRVVIDGTTYQGNPVGTTPSVSSAIRQVDTNSPVKGATNPDINCGASAQEGASLANANPGSNVQVAWVGGTSGTGDPWPHNTGPIMHYMALCDGSCASYNSSGAQWFKISEQGQLPGGSGWYQGQIASGSPAMVTIPSNLAPGNYLLRSELIALQLATTQGGAEFYPACIQMTVGGSQTGKPSSSDLVSLPGAYSDTDPGILAPNVYNPGFNYTFPGPPIASFISGGSGSGSSGGSSSTTSGGSSSASGSGSGSRGGSGSSVPATPSTPAGSYSGSPPASPPATAPANPSASSPAGPSAPSMPSSSAPNGGGHASGTAPSNPSSTGGSGSSCTHKRSVLERRTSVDHKRMHRRRFPASH